jgi:hypothetical protein
MRRELVGMPVIDQFLRHTALVDGLEPAT